MLYRNYARALRVSLFFGLFYLSFNSLAQEPHPDDLGRLFFTPEQRVWLEQQQAQTQQPAKADVVAKPVVKPPSLPDSIQFNGVFLSAHPPIVWLNQQTAPWPPAIKTVRYHATSQMVDIVGQDGTKIQLRIGETWQKSVD
jgi:hypothetical protein